MTKLTYFHQVRAYQKDHPSLTWKECCSDVSLFIQSGKNEASAKKEPAEAKPVGKIKIAPCIRCGYEIEDPGTAFVCAACGIQN